MLGVSNSKISCVFSNNKSDEYIASKVARVFLIGVSISQMYNKTSNFLTTKDFSIQTIGTTILFVAFWLFLTSLAFILRIVKVAPHKEIKKEELENQNQGKTVAPPTDPNAIEALKLREHKPCLSVDDSQSLPMDSIILASYEVLSPKLQELNS